MICLHTVPNRMKITSVAVFSVYTVKQ